jgi:hypothetical protein
MREHESVAYEEMALKREAAARLGLTYLPQMLANVELFPNKFQQDILRTLRLSFTTSDLLMKRGGRKFIDEHDFKKPIDPENERMSIDFLT